MIKSITILPFHNHGAASVETARGQISHFRVDNYFKMAAWLLFRGNFTQVISAIHGYFARLFILDVCAKHSAASHVYTILKINDFTAKLQEIDGLF